MARNVYLRISIPFVVAPKSNAIAINSAKAHGTPYGCIAHVWYKKTRVLVIVMSEPVFYTRKSKLNTVKTYQLYSLCTCKTLWNRVSGIYKWFVLYDMTLSSTNIPVNSVYTLFAYNFTDLTTPHKACIMYNLFNVF